MPHSPARRRRAASFFLSLLGLSTCAAAALGLAVATPTPAHAHAGLTSSTPQEGEVLSALPDEVTLTFSEEISSPAYVAVRTADGTTYEDGAASIDGPVVTQQLVAADEPGTYTIAYRVVSEDGHVVTGEFDVTVEGDADAGSDADASSDSAAESGTDDGSTSDALSSDSPSTTLVATGVVVALLVVGAVVLALARKPRR